MARRLNDKIRRWLGSLNDDTAARAADWLSELTNKIKYEDARDTVFSILSAAEILPGIVWFATGLATDPRVPIIDKMRIGLVVAHLIGPPIPVIEAMLGPAALVDDVAMIVILMLLVANLMQKVDDEVLLDNWVGARSQGEQIVEACRALRKLLYGADVARRIASPESPAI